MFKLLNNLDFQITNSVNLLLPHNQFFDFFFSFFSQKGGSIFIWIGIILFLVLFEERKNKKFIIYFLVCFLTAGIVSNLLLKNVFQRHRPVKTYSFTQQAITCKDGYSFPSGHAATAFAAAAVLARFDKKRKYFYYLVAGLIGLSRIYLQCHYLFDVVVGAVIGCTVSFLILPRKIKK